MKKFALLGILVVLLPALLFAAGAAEKGATQKQKVVFSTGMPDQAWKNTLEHVIAEANKRLDGIEIVPEYYPSEEDMWKMLPAQIVSGAAPDLIGVNNEGVLELIVNGTLASLDGLVTQEGFNLAALDQANVNGWRYEGDLYALPFTTTVSGLAVNMSMLRAVGINTAPRTVDEMIAAAVATTDRAKGTFGVGINLHEYHITQYVHAMGGGWDFARNLNNADNRNGLQLVVDLFNKYQVAVTPQQMGLKGDTDAFASGKVAMTTAGPWYIPALREMDVDFDWIIVPIPAGKGQKSTVYGWGLSILNSTKDKSVTMKALAAMLGEDAYEYLVEVRGDIPAMTKYVSRYEELYPEMAAVLATADNGSGFDYPAAANRFKSDLVTGMESIIFQRGNTTVNSLLAAMAADGYAR
ncbi:MAG: extracellular solute-binding protein [Sphaerochaeta sp.]